ncbi:hypothetical protein [Psychromonas arctica]|uniref:hypothetical protein n=1 Tax=Psychromonas arctica TaxID=168275 RepID=UPI002FD0254D
MLTSTQELETIKAFGLIAMTVGGSKLKVNWAMSLLEQGVETENLCILASLLNPLNEFEVDEHFNIVISELDLKFPKLEEAVEGYVKILAHEVIRGMLPPEDGASKIYDANVFLGYPESFSEYTIYEDEWYCEHINGWSKEKRQEEIIQACKVSFGLLRYPSIIKV